MSIYLLQETKGSERREYPVSRAQKLNHEVKKLGANENGQSYMDQFRMLIAEIGNALGFVRMVRLGGLSYCSASSGYVDCKTFHILLHFNSIIVCKYLFVSEIFL
jgi:WASH complex subunit 7